jgi:hypothetical protein
VHGIPRLACAGLFVAAATAAQIPKTPAEPGSIEIGAGVGRFWGGSFAAGSNSYFDQRVIADDDVLKGVWVGSQLSKDWAVEIAVRRTATHFLLPAGGVFPTEQILAGFPFTTVEAAGTRTWRLGNLVPYAGLAMGVANLNPDIPNNPAVHDTTRFCVSGVVGTKFYAFPWLGIRVDFRARATYLGTPRSGDSGLFAAGRWFTNQDFLFGAFLAFGTR